jgi:PAS domain S-box-containing protein
MKKVSTITDKQRQEFLFKATKELSSSLEYNKTLKKLSKLIVPQLADWFSIDLLNSKGTLDLLLVSHIDPKKEKWAIELRKEQPIDMSSKAGVPNVIKTGRAELYPYLSEEILLKSAQNEKQKELIKQLQLRSAMIVPLSARKKHLGAITFVTTEESKNYYTQNDLIFAKEFANRVSMALDNALLFKESQESKNKFKHLFNGMEDAVMVFDGKGKIVDINPSAEKMFNYSKKEFLSMTVKDFKGRNDRDSSEYLETLKKTGTFKEEGAFMKKNGKIIYIDSRSTAIEMGENTLYISVIRDVTEKQKNIVLNSRLAAIVESSDDAIVGKDLDAKITSWNKGAQRIYGYTKEEIVGKPILSLFPDHRKKELEMLMKQIRKGKAIDHYTTERKRKDGKIIDVSITISPVRDHTGVITGASTIARDISQQRKMEMKKDEFLGIASHELKTPITSIKAFAQMLEKYFIDMKNPTTSSYMNKMNKQIDRLNKLVQDLLDVSKIQSGKLDYTEEVFNFDSLVNETIQEMQPITNTHRIIFKGNADLSVLADNYRIKQVLINLISNAIKYSPRTDKIIVTSQFKNNEIIVSVQDFGIGIPRIDQKNLFQRFYRVSDRKRESFPGLGLGLYICREIINRQGGKMWVESQEGKGSIFYFSIPITLHYEKYE